jgi:hypothetical protein
MLWYPFIARHGKADKRGFPVSCRFGQFPFGVLLDRMEIQPAPTMTVQIVYTL